MTNGQKIEQITNQKALIDTFGTPYMVFNKKMWNEEYKEPIKALEQEPTTKNNSPKYCDRNICLKNEYNNIGCEDCEVTKSQEPTTKNDLPQTMEELFKYLTDKIPSWKVILIDKWTDFKVWLWIKTHKGADRWE